MFTVWTEPTEIDNLYIYKCAIIRILHSRGYTVSDEELHFIKKDRDDAEEWYDDYDTYGERISLFREYLYSVSGGNRRAYVNAFNMEYRKGDRVLSVRYITNSENVKKDDAKRVVGDMLRTNPNAVLLVYNNQPTQQAKDIIKRIKDTGTDIHEGMIDTVESYIDIDLVFVSMRHSLSPSITLMTDSEKGEAVTDARVHPRHFPKMKSSDPVVIRGGFKPGSMLRIIRHDDVYSTATESSMFLRIVSP